METGTNRIVAFYKIIIWILIIIVTLFFHFVYYDIQLTKMNKQANKKIGSNWKSMHLGYCKGGHAMYVFKQSVKELISRYSWLWNFKFTVL